MKSKLLFCLLLLMYLLVYVESDFDSYALLVKKGGSFTLKYRPWSPVGSEVITWKTNNLEIKRVRYKYTTTHLWDICTDIKSKDHSKRLKDRLKLNPDGSLTITNATITDSGRYMLMIEHEIHGNGLGVYTVVVRGFVNFDKDRLSVMEGDSLTLKTGHPLKLHRTVLWYFNDSHIANICGYSCVTCTDVQCNEDTEMFTDRLKLSNETGSLTITNIRTTDSGLYDALIMTSICRRRNRSKVFLVAVDDVPAAERDEMKRKLVKEGESVTLDTRVIKKRNSITWYFNDTLIAEITTDRSKICTGVQCEDADRRFRDRLKLNNRTGSLTITNTTTTDSGDYKLQINSSRYSIIRSFSVTVTVVSGFERYTVFVKEGDSITLKYGPWTPFYTDWVIWTMNNLIVERTGVKFLNTYFLDICGTDVQCKDHNRRLKDRLKLNPDGSLTITNVTNKDSGRYKLLIEGLEGTGVGIYTVVVRGFVSFDKDRLSVMEGDSLTLKTGHQTKQQGKTEWYFNNTHIDRIYGHPCFSCKDVKCDGCKERFRDRLNLHNQTGSLTITNIRTTDSGLYDVLITSYHRHRGSRSRSRTKFFLVAVDDAPEQDEMKRKSAKQGESVTLDTRVINKQKNSITWYFNDTLIAEITTDRSKICTGVQCEDADRRFRDRLKLDDKTGSLTITNTTTTDSGLYKLLINSSRYSIIRSFSVTVTGGCIDLGLDKIQWTNTSRRDGTPNHH